MKILDEPIGTWISIAAFLISFSTLLLALRKQRHDERVMLAGKVTEIKTIFGEEIRIIDELLEKYQNLENLMQKAVSEKETSKVSGLLEKVGNNRLKLESSRTRIEGMYNNLGFKTLKTTDPVVLSAVVVESADIRKDLENEKILIERVIRDTEEILKEKSEPSANTRAQRNKSVKKQSVRGKKD